MSADLHRTEAWPDQDLLKLRMTLCVPVYVVDRRPPITEPLAVQGDINSTSVAEEVSINGKKSL